MTGHIRQRGRTWSCYWSTVDAGTGARRQFSKGGFEKKKAAQDYLNKVLGKVSEGTWTPDQPLSLAQLLLEHWLPAQRSRGLRPSTLAQYSGMVNWYLVPQLGHRKVATLSPADVSALVEHMRTAESASGRQGVSARTAQAAVTSLKAATAWAFKNAMLSRDPLAGVDRPRLERKPMKSWSTEEARAFLDHVRGDRLEAAWALFLTRPLRRGEVAGLRWDAIDLDEGVMQITRTRVSVDGVAMDSVPKTESGRRSVPLDAGLVALLRVRRAQQQREQLAAENWSGAGHVFTNEVGQPYHPDHYGDRFEELEAAAGLPRIRLHDTRHTACSLMLAGGVPVKVVQELAGHSSPAITLALYTHTTPSMGKAAGEALSASLLS